MFHDVFILIVILCVCSLVVYGLNALPMIQQPFKGIIICVVCLLFAAFLLDHFVFGGSGMGVVCR